MMGQIIEKSYDFIVVGGGMSGVCASIAAARKGVRTALIQNRPVLSEYAYDRSLYRAREQRSEDY